MIERKITIESGANGDGLRLNIKDGESGLSFAEVRLTPEQIWTMVRGGHMELTAEGTEHLDRFGKAMVHETFEVPDEVLDGSGWGPEALKLADSWTRVEHPGWDSYSARRTNQGTILVIARKYVAVGSEMVDGFIVGPHRGGGFFARKDALVMFGDTADDASAALKRELEQGK